MNVPKTVDFGGVIYRVHVVEFRTGMFPFVCGIGSDEDPDAGASGNGQTAEAAFEAAMLNLRASQYE